MAEIPERVKALLEDYTAAVEQALPGLMAACYLHSSIALDAFVPGQSDVDMITVISRRCTSEEIERLAALHRDLRQKYPQQIIQCSYLQRGDLGRFTDTSERYPCFYDEQLIPAGHHDINSVTWWILKNRGVALVGPEPDTLDFSVYWDMLIRKMLQNMKRGLMRRSEINTIMREADTFIKAHQFYLPPFAYWTPDDWRAKGPEAGEIAHHNLGWDITDFGQGKYDELGLFLFTIRNGALNNLKTGRGKVYAEKLLLVGVEQITPYHFHWQKTEDIINRGGGSLMIQLYNSTTDENLDTYRNITVSLDGVAHTLPAGAVVRLEPGESITLTTGLYHQFWAEVSRVLCGEVSTVNDDYADNRFLDPVGRFATIEEDEPPLHLLVGDYKQYYAHAG